MRATKGGAERGLGQFDNRHREQARSHNDWGNDVDIQAATNPVGASLLAIAVGQRYMC